MKFLAKTLIASGVALSALTTVYATEQQQQPQNTERKTAAGQYVDDSAITAKVKAKHADDKVVSALGVNVETKQGVVILSGEAKSDNEKSRAETLAKQVEGVKSVSNKIAVKPNS